MRFDPIYYFVFAVLAYLLGSIPTGLVAARLLGGVDPRTAGSENIGATNVARTSGRGAGVLTLAGDLAKGAVPVLAARGFSPDTFLISIVGLAAFIGHLFPIYLKFKGGKGVATAFGVMLAAAPVVALLSALVFVVVVALKRYVSLGSMAAAGALPVILSFFTGSRQLVPMAVVISALVILRHNENIKRLIAGRENKIGGRKG